MQRHNPPGFARGIGGARTVSAGRSESTLLERSSGSSSMAAYGRVPFDLGGVTKRDLEAYTCTTLHQMLQHRDVEGRGTMTTKDKKVAGLMRFQKAAKRDTVAKKKKIFFTDDLLNAKKKDLEALSIAQLTSLLKSRNVKGRSEMTCKAEKVQGLMHSRRQAAAKKRREQAGNAAPPKPLVRQQGHPGALMPAHVHRPSGNPEAPFVQTFWAGIITDRGDTFLDYCLQEMPLRLIRLGVPRNTPSKDVGVCCMYFTTNGKRYVCMLGKDTIPYSQDDLGNELTSHAKTMKYAMRKLEVNTVDKAVGFWITFTPAGPAPTFKSCANYFTRASDIGQNTRALQSKQQYQLVRLLRDIQSIPEIV